MLLTHPRTAHEKNRIRLFIFMIFVLLRVDSSNPSLQHASQTTGIRLDAAWITLSRRWTSRRTHRISYGLEVQNFDINA